MRVKIIILTFCIIAFFSCKKENIENINSNNEFFLISGAGTVTETIIDDKPKEKTVRAQAVPKAGSYFWHWASTTNQLARQYVTQNPLIMPFQNSNQKVTAYFLDHPIYYQVPNTNLLRYFEALRNDALYQKAWAMATNITNDKLDTVLNQTIIKIYPPQQHLGDGTTYTRSEYLAINGMIEMLEISGTTEGHVTLFAHVMIHELGHVIHSDKFISLENIDESHRLYERYKQEAINAGININEHYQLWGGQAEWWACSVAAYLNASHGGSGTIGDKAALQIKYPLMYNLMTRIPILN